MSYLFLKTSSDHGVAPLNGIRAIACIFVVITHLALSFPVLSILISLPFSEFGVGVFFTLSGFLMSHLYFSRHWNRKNVVSYTIARFSRIAPAYWLIVFFSYVLSNTILPDFVYSMDAHNLLRHIFFGGSVSVFWSISPEVQYYVFFVFFWFAFSAFLSGRFVFMILFVLVSIVMICFRVVSPGLLLSSKLHLFLVGSCFGAFNLKPELLKKYKLLIGILQATCIPLVFLYVYHSGVNYLMFYNRLDFAFLIGLSIFLISHSTRTSEAIFSGRILKVIGAASFSIYLLHDVVIYFFLKIVANSNTVTMFAICAILCIVLPVIFSIYIEMPLCRLVKSRLSKYAVPFFAKNATVSG
ncbi:acyltransferase [Aquitalea sp. LB_tupeE]|uniref:acyltransferase family protein n=1 Tax=Aquitalea sp. LB_tupeE TaxID=2748078 RepID=UPI0015BD5853|nr:acyltransferase [Aquitalea sp. LB_tupeE]NWK79440.1 acyltransferase [Aquitalea sp. LB_tupeE]